MRSIHSACVGIFAVVWLLVPAVQPAAAAGGPTDWRPEKPVEIVVPTAAGGENDRVARRIQQILQDRKLVTTPVVVVNREGGNQVLAVVRVTQNAPDPHFLLYSTATLFTNQIAGLTPLHYRDLTPISLLLLDSTTLTVKAESPIKNMRDLVDRLKSDPKSIAFGTVARGGPNHLALSQAMRSAGIDPKALKLVIFKTNAESMTAVMGGHIDVVASSVSAAFNNVQAGFLRMLAVAAAQRPTGPLAGVPTMAESGIDATGVSNWRCIFAPKGLTAAQRTFWENAMAEVNQTAEWRKDIDARNLIMKFMRGRDLESYLDETYKATRATMIDIGIVK
jgi:putative tricarboxylic transport membrane protein